MSDMSDIEVVMRNCPGARDIVREARALPVDQRFVYMDCAVPIRWGPEAYKLLCEAAMAPAVKEDQ